MKKYFRIFTAIVTLSLLIGLNSVSVAQPPPPPPPGGGHGGGGNQPPAGAPVGEGMFLLLGLAGLYGGKKVYETRKALKSENN